MVYAPPAPRGLLRCCAACVQRCAACVQRRAESNGIITLKQQYDETNETLKLLCWTFAARPPPPRCVCVCACLICCLLWFPLGSVFLCLLKAPCGVAPPSPIFRDGAFVECAVWRLTAFCDLLFGGSCLEEFVCVPGSLRIIGWFFAVAGNLRTKNYAKI